MPIEVLERAQDGTYTTMPDPGDATTSPPVVPQGETVAPAETAPDRTPGVQGESAPPPEDAPPPDDASLAASQSEGEDADVADDAATVPFVNRRIKQLNAKRRETEKQLALERQANALRQAQLEARLDTLTRVLSGSAPALPEAPAPPTGPPQAEQYADHDTYLDARSTWNAQQLIAREREQAQQATRHQQLVARVETFKQERPDYETVMQAGYYGKVAPHVDQLVSFLPEGPALAYQLARQPALVQRLNTLPPPLVLVELGRLSSQPGTASPAVGSTNGTTPPAVPQTPLPEPMAPVGGGGSMVQPVFSENMSQKDYEAWRARTSQLPYLRRS